MFLGFKKKIQTESTAGLSKFVPRASMADFEKVPSVVIEQS